MDLSKVLASHLLVTIHELVITNLYVYVFSKDALKLIYSYLSDCWQMKKIDKSFSSSSELMKGVPRSQF